jgi:hypothetical protein
MKKSLCVIGAILPFLLGCMDSALSDVEIDDFGLISGTFTVDKSNGTDVSVTAAIRDKNSYGVHIKNGSVTINGAEMDFGDAGKVYQKNNLPVVKNSVYTFVITLPSGDTSQSVIRTPKAEFGVVTCPDTIHIRRDTAVTWSDFAGAGNYLDYTLHVRSDAETDPVYEIAAQGSIVDSGRLVFASSMFNPTHDFGLGYLMLFKKTTGNTSLLLRSGSEISSTFKWQASLILKL